MYFMISNLNKEEIIEIHNNIVKSTSEELDILSEHKLDAIISKHKRAKTLTRKAAILLHDISYLQPFSEGNKRTAFASTMIFLKYNKRELKLSKRRVEEIIIYSVNNNLTLGEVEKILKEAII